MRHLKAFPLTRWTGRMIQIMSILVNLSLDAISQTHEPSSIVNLVRFCSGWMGAAFFLIKYNRLVFFGTNLANDQLNHKRLGVMYIVLAPYHATTWFFWCHLTASELAIATNGDPGLTCLPHHMTKSLRRMVSLWCIFMGECPLWLVWWTLLFPLQIRCSWCAYPFLNNLSFC